MAADPALLAETLCIEEERVVARDNTVAYDGRRLQLPESKARAHYVKARVKVREYPDGSLAVFHGPRRIAAYTAQGAQIAEVPTTTSVTPCSPPSRTLRAACGGGLRPSLTAAARGVTAPRQVGTWRNRGVTTAGTGWPPRNAKGARPCPRASSMSASMCHLKETSICVIDDADKIVWRGQVEFDAGSHRDRP